MAIFRVYTRGDAANGFESRAVPDRFIWSAAIFTPVWMIARGLWVAFFIWMAFVVVLAAIVPYVSGDGAFLAYVAVSVLIGFEASAIAGASLARSGWREEGEVIATTSDLAEKEVLDRRDTRGWA